jgi:hypothetical protein
MAEPIRIRRGQGTCGDRSLAQLFDSNLADVKAATSLAAIDGELMAITAPTGCSIPEIQSDAVPLGRSAIVVEDFAAASIGTRKDELRLCHSDWPYLASALVGEAWITRDELAIT